MMQPLHVALQDPPPAGRIQRLDDRENPAPGRVCTNCDVAWAGEEADCWRCGRPATSEHTKFSSALDLLLSAVKPNGKYRKDVDV